MRTGGYDINGEFRDPFPCALSDIHECRGEVREEWVGAGTYEAYCELAREQIKEDAAANREYARREKRRAS